MKFSGSFSHLKPRARAFELSVTDSKNILPNKEEVKVARERKCPINYVEIARDVGLQNHDDAI